MLVSGNGYTYPKTKLNAVFDLDETLVHTQESIEDLERLGIFTQPELLDIRSNTYVIDMWDPITHKGRGVHYREWGTMRPHLHSFLEFSNAYFDTVVIWTAGRERYADAIVNFIYNGLEPPAAVLHYDHLAQKSKPIFQISKSKGIYPRARGRSLDHLNVKNTLVFDDRESNFALNPDNGILIPPYEPQPNITSLRMDDDTLPKLQRWLLTPEVRYASDVRLVQQSWSP